MPQAAAAPRVGYVVYSYPAISQTFITREVAELRRLGFQVHVFSLHRTPADELLDDEMREAEARTPVLLPLTPLRAVRVELLAALRSPRRWLRSLCRGLREAEPGLRGRVRGLGAHAVAADLSRALGHLGVRHIHTHFAGTPTHVASLAAELRSGRTWSLTVHGPVEFFDVTLLRLAERVSQASFTAAISDVARGQLLAMMSSETHGRVHLVRCGVDAARFSPPDARPEGGPLRVLTVGRLVGVKGQSILLDSIGTLLERGIDVHLTVVGDGPLRGVLEAQAARLRLGSHVSFVGAESPARIGRRCAEAQVFCLPSFAEGIPVVLMEALATELAVVATRVGGIPELVEHGETGLIVSPARPDQLADALALLAREPELRARLGRAGRRRVQQEYDARRSAKTLARLLSVAALGAEDHATRTPPTTGL